MRVQVLFFGLLKDICGGPRDSLDLPAGSSAGAVFDHYAARFPRLREMASSIVLARNHEFAKANDLLSDGDEVALLPPVSGGAYVSEIRDPEGHFFALTRDPIDPRAIESLLLQGCDGAIVTFHGVVRNNSSGRRTMRLDYEGYEPMALRKMAEIGREVAARFAISRIAMVHRLGTLEIGEASVLVVAVAPHRRPAFDAALEGIDQIKKLVPIWKKEFFEDGEYGWKEPGPTMRLACRLLSGVALLGAGLSAQDAIFRSDVQLVRILATVKDPAGTLVGTLEKADFSVRDNGVTQQISVFERQTDQPLSVAILIDNSGSTAKDLRFEIDSVSRFLRAVLREGNPEDRVALYSFNWQIIKQNSFTRDAGAVDRSLKGLRGEAGTALYDAILLASRDIEDRVGRKVLVIVTDGGDTTSRSDFQRAVEAAQLADAVIYPLLVVPITNEAGRNIGGENALTTLAQRTGGRVFEPSLGAALDQAFDQILRDLRTQYLIGFYPRNVTLTNDRYHALEVSVVNPQLQVKARSGYYGDALKTAAAANANVNPDSESVRPPKPKPPATPPGRKSTSN